MKVELKSAHVLQALSLAEAGVKGEKRVRDTLVPGLCLRIRGRSASWHLMTRAQSLRLANADDLSVKEARERARSVVQETKPQIKRAVAVMLEAGIPSIDANLIARGLPIDPTDKWVGTWTWSKAMGEFLVAKAEELSPNWFRQFKRFAKDDVFFPLEERAIAKMEFAHLDAIRHEGQLFGDAGEASDGGGDRDAGLDLEGTSLGGGSSEATISLVARPQPFAEAEQGPFRPDGRHVGKDVGGPGGDTRA
jgi:hypothetical protein